MSNPEIERLREKVLQKWNATPALDNPADGPGPLDRLYERETSARLTALRLLVLAAVTGLYVVWPNLFVLADPKSLNVALIGACLVAVYLTVSLVLILLWPPFITFDRASGAYTELTITVALVIATGALQSPFLLYLALTVAGTIFTSRKFVLVTSFLASISLSATLTYGLAGGGGKDLAFVERCFAIYVFGLMVRSQSALLVRQAEYLAVLERFGSEMSSVSSESDALESFRHVTEGLWGAGCCRTFLFSSNEDMSNRKASSQRQFWDLAVGNSSIGLCLWNRPRRIDYMGARLMSALCERLTSAVRRIQLTSELISSATKEERLRMADELHDGYLQTLAAINIRTQAAKLLLDEPEKAEDELEEVQRMVTKGTFEAREFINEALEREIGGRAEIEKLIASKWHGASEINLGKAVALTEGQWRVTQMLVREGLTNARRHGHATAVKVSIGRKGEHIVVELESDGRSPTDLTQLGYGLTRLAAVAAQNGGKIRLEKREPEGAILSAVFEEQNWYGS